MNLPKYPVEPATNMRSIIYLHRLLLSSDCI
jgi:hypothetical protein